MKSEFVISRVISRERTETPIYGGTGDREHALLCAKLQAQKYADPV
jgi:hypothetical protein